jgi:hypothetical protein
MRYVSTPLLWALLQSTRAGLTATVSTASAHKSAALSQLYLARQLSQVKLSGLFILQENASFSFYEPIYQPLDAPLPSGSVCSGRGTCSYLDPAGAALSSCSILSVGCTAKCVCDTGSGGIDCSLTDRDIVEKSNLRYCY